MVSSALTRSLAIGSAPPNSAASSLPTAFWWPEFRCRTAWRYAVQGLAMALLFGDGKVIFRPRMRIYPCRQGQTENSMRSPAGRAQAGRRRMPQGEQARSARPKSGQAVERGIEQGAKACALIEVR